MLPDLHETFKIIEPYLNENGIVMEPFCMPSWSSISALPTCILRIRVYQRILYLEGARLTMVPMPFMNAGSVMSALRYDLHDPESLPRLVQQLKVERNARNLQNN